MLVYQVCVTVALLLTALLAWRNHRDFRRPASTLAGGAGRPRPKVSVLVPARNEASNISACLAGLLAQDYPELEFVVLDDGSTDGTAELVEKVSAGDPRVRLVRGSALPPGWAGKAHACWELAHHSEGEWLLFVDADTRHRPDLVARAVSEALRSRADLLSTFPRQEIGSIGEALTVPMIYWVLFTLLPVGWIEQRGSPAFTAACGQFLLARRTVYFETGGHRSIAGSLHDGLHLARHFKACGRRLVLVDLSSSISCRMYRGWRECWSGFSRNAYQAIGSLPVLVFLMLLETALCLSPPASLLATLLLREIPGWEALPLVQLGLVAVIQVGLKLRFGYPWLTVALFPLAVAAFLAIQWKSWWNTTFGSPQNWKGRIITSPRSARG